MKLKTARLRIEKLEETNQRWGKALSGKLRPRPNEESIILSRWDQLGRVFSPARLQILAELPTARPKSISELARSLKRDFKNVYQDVRLLADLGLIELREEGKRKTLVPVAKFKALAMTFST